MEVRKDVKYELQIWLLSLLTVQSKRGKPLTMKKWL